MMCGTKPASVRAIDYTVLVRTATDKTSGLSTLIKDHLAGGASRPAALLLLQILPVFSVVAPCRPGAARRDLVLVQRGCATSRHLSTILSSGRRAFG